MAHEVTIRKNGKAEMAYVGETPWHGLGSKLEGGATHDQWRVAAGMDWDIERAPAQFTAIDGETYAIDEKVVLYRSDTNHPLGIVSDRYEPVQPAEVLGFFDDLTKSVGMQLETAGTLFGGKRFWALARVGEQFTLPGNDRIENFLLLATSADGTMQTQARFTAVRVVCNNTLSMATRAGQAAVMVRHSTKFIPTVVKEQLGLAHEAFAEFKETAVKLADRKLEMREAEAMTASLLGEKDGVESTRTYKLIMQHYADDGLGAHLAAADDTAWGWLNAVTQFIDHDTRTQTASHRMSSAWFGRGDATKTGALQLALATVA